MNNWMLGVGFWNLDLLDPRPLAIFGQPSDFPQRSSSSPPVGRGRCWRVLVAPGNRPRTLPTVETLGYYQMSLRDKSWCYVHAFERHHTSGRIGKSNWILEFSWMLGVGFWNLALCAPIVLFYFLRMQR